MASCEQINVTQKQEITNSLQEIGLNRYESYVYLALVTEGISTAKDIANITGIPYGKVYEIIKTLTNKSFCKIIPSKPMKYMANSPKNVVFEIKKKANERYDALEKNIINSLEPIFLQNKILLESKNPVMIINGRANVVKKIDELISNAQKSIYIHCSSNFLSRLVIHKVRLKDAYTKGVKIRIAGDITDGNLSDMDSLNFCEFKKTCKAPSNYISYDHQECLVVQPMPDDDDIMYGKDTGIHITSDAFAQLLDSLFCSQFDDTQKAE